MGQEGLRLYQNWENVIFSDESTFKPYFFCKPFSIWRLKHEQIYPHYIDGWVKFYLSRIEGYYLVTFKGVSQLKLVNETITSKAYQDNIKSDIKLQYESRVNI